MPPLVRIGTRASRLALTQTGHVAADLSRLGGFETETVHVRTDGDRLTGSLASLGGTGVFVTALRDALLDGRCDVAVHSLKDLPTAAAPGLTIAAVPPREDPHDVLCARDGLALRDLPPGARVGTGSPRRAAQLLAARPDLVVVDIRGNVDTRLGRVAGHPDGPGDLDAILLARAGLARLGRLDAVTEVLDDTVMLPAPGQGALAVEVRTADLADPTTPLARALAALDDRPTRLAVAAERALLARLEAGCAAPVGAIAHLVGARLTLEAVVASTDGSRTLRHGAVAEARRAHVAPPRPDASAPDLGAAASADHADLPDEAMARSLGAQLADLLLEQGAAELAPLGPGA
ncbi:hydroxymethylbilane synthase [Cellulomonas composti]|nr:hydroxymethylbilane synthase [Cellulomonas composti]